MVVETPAGGQTRPGFIASASDLAPDLVSAQKQALPTGAGTHVTQG